MTAGGFRLPAGYVSRADPAVTDEFARPRPDWPRVFYDIAAGLGAAAGATALVDLGCGTGRHLLEHADRFDLVGIDLEPTICSRTTSQARPLTSSRHQSGYGRGHDGFARDRGVARGAPRRP